MVFRYHTMMKLGTAFAAVILIAAHGWADEPHDTRGPVQVAGLTPKVTADGVEAPGYRWTPFPTDPDQWTAGWVSAPRATNGENVTASILRGSLELGFKPVRVEARMTASAPYFLYVNGIPVSRGPADQGHDFSNRGKQPIPFYDLRDLTPFFHRGKNAVAVLTDPGAKVLFEAVCTSPEGKKVTVGTDGNWKGLPAAFLTLSTIPAKESSRQKPTACSVFEGTKEPCGWSAPGFDDSTWAMVSPPSPVGKGSLQPSELPPCMETVYPVKQVIPVEGSAITVPPGALKDGKPLVITTNGAVQVLFDRVMSARVGFKIKGSEGAEMSFIPTELPGKGGTPAGILRLRSGIQTFETRRFHAMGAVRLEFRNVTKPLEVLEVTADWTSQPVAYEGSFECSDPFLNRLWKVCRTSVQINLQTHHLDSPSHQEPISDYGDYLIEDLVAYDAFGYGNPWLVRQDLRKWAAVMRDAGYHTFHTSYALMWLQALMNYYDRTGDAALVKELAPVIHELLGKFATYVGSEGLVSQAPDYMFMDWVTLGGLPAHHPPAEIGMGYMTALYYKALADGIRVSEITGESDKASSYRNLRAGILPAYNSLLWDPSAGLYKDGVSHLSKVAPHQWMPADRGTVTHSAQNNSMAVAYGLADDKKPEELMKRTLAIQPWNLQPYFMHFVFDAMDRSGVYDKEANDWLRKWTINDQTQSLLEANGMGDLSHGWTSTPLYQMSSRILGVEPASPGFGRILIRPRPGGLEWASGSVPTPHGPVQVSWKISGGQFTLHATIPSQAESAVIEVPGMQTKAAAQGDAPAPQALGTQNGRVSYEVKPGSYSITSQLDQPPAAR